MDKTQSLSEIADNFYEISAMTEVDAIAHEDARSNSASLHLKRFTSNKKAAFTLAEVLITLGIIGVVAALTLPTLIQHHRKSAIETSLAKFYSVINQAVQMAEVEYGDVAQWDTYESLYEQDEEGKDDKTKPLPNIEYFNKYFAPYLNVSKTEVIDGTSYIAVYFNDGTAAAFSAVGIRFYPKAKDLETTIDEDGTTKLDSNTDGTKAFLFMISPGSANKGNYRWKYHYGKRVEPYLYDWDGDRESLFTSSSFGCKTETVQHTHAYCTALIQMNGWKIPNDYPFKF